MPRFDLLLDRLQPVVEDPEAGDLISGRAERELRLDVIFNLSLTLALDNLPERADRVFQVAYDFRVW